MSSGRSSGAGVVLGLTILGFIIFLFIFWPVAFAILFIGLAVFCALQSSQRTQRSRLPPERRPRRYQPPTPPQRPEWETPQRPSYYPSPRREPSPRSGVRIPVEESEPETERVYRMPAAEEEPEVSTSIPERISREEPRVSKAEEGTALGNLEEELEATRSKYEKMGTTLEPTEKIEKETPTAKQITIPDEKAERIKDLESEEEATQVLLEELKGRWMSGKIDIDMYERLKEKYEKKIEDIEKQKKET